MFKLSLKHLGIITGLLLALVLTACGSDNGNNNNNVGNNEGNNEANNNTENEENEEVSVDYSEEVDYKVTGIEPGAGVFNAAESAVEEYGLDGWEVVASSSGAMAVALGEAISKEEPIIVTGWSPHWKFSQYDLKYLDDPKEVFGGSETINTMVREGLEDEQPEAYEVLGNFSWEPEDIEAVMLDIENGDEAEEAAQKWVDENQDTVDSWIEGIEVDGKEIELAYVNWDTEIASTNVVKIALEAAGFEVEITPLDNAIMWEAVATGEADAMVAAWLPGTHKEQFDKYGDQMEDLGPNLEGAKIGLVVPTYMDIDSIEDLIAK